QHAFLGRDAATKRYRLGVAAMELGARSRAVLDTRVIFLDTLRELCEVTGETAMLCALDASGESGFCIDQIETCEPLRMSIQPGHALPLHAGAMGKALLAFLPPERLEQLLSRPLTKLCTNTITSPVQLRSELEEIRTRGY